MAPTTDPLPLVLASSSPRRREILGRLDLAFRVEPADIDETPHPDEPAAEYVARLAREKAAVVTRPRSITIAADTAVVLDGQILGKPRDHDHGVEMLRALADRSHEVMTGVAVVADAGDGPRAAVDVATSTVRVGPIPDPTMSWYLATGEADDKAGAYGLQGAAALFADEVDGSVSNVIGLPLPLVDRLASSLGHPLLGLRRTS